MTNGFYDPAIERDADARRHLPCASLEELVRTLSVMGIDAVRRMFGRAYLLPLYHIVGDEPVPHVKNLFEYCSFGHFESDHDWYLERFTPVELDDTLAYLNGTASLPENFMHLTIDDGEKTVSHRARDQETSRRRVHRRRPLHEPPLLPDGER